MNLTFKSKSFYRLVKKKWQIRMFCIVKWISHRIVTSLVSLNQNFKTQTTNKLYKSVRRQDEPSPAMWLAAWADKMALLCLLGITSCVPQENSWIFGQNAEYWPHSFFFAYLWTFIPFRCINTQKRLGQYPPILALCLLNNLYMYVKENNY